MRSTRNIDSYPDTARRGLLCSVRIPLSIALLAVSLAGTGLAGIGLLPAAAQVAESTPQTGTISPDLRRKAKLGIAFGRATWPHQMVRVMLLEQIYRAATILSGHPYHRA